jgi:hypothetical protein
MKISLWLSQHRVGEVDSVTWRSLSNWTSQAMLAVATAKERYSASTLDHEIILCFLEDHEIKLEPRKIA